MKNLMKRSSFITILLFAFMVIPCSAKGNHKKFVIGFNCGYSFLLERDYYEEYTYNGEYRRENKFGFRGGVNLQYYFSQHFAVQIEMDYQRETLYEEFKDYAYPEYNYVRNKDISFTVFYLNFIYRSYDLNKQDLSPYFFAGVGIDDIDPFVLYSKLGLGIQYIFSSRVILHTEVSVGPATFIYRDPFALRLFPFNIKYISLNFGLEYLF